MSQGCSGTRSQRRLQSTWRRNRDWSLRAPIENRHLRRHRPERIEMKIDRRINVGLRPQIHRERRLCSSQPIIPPPVSLAGAELLSRLDIKNKPIALGQPSNVAEIGLLL